jgi:hypothetical protein
MITVLAKRCTKCGEEKILENFPFHHVGHRAAMCKSCKAFYNKKYREKHPEMQRKAVSKHASNLTMEQRIRRFEQQRVAASQRTKNLKGEAFNHYGGPKCSCCGETGVLFLTIDHMNNDGYEHRKAGIRSGTTLYRWLRTQGYPTGFQVLCFNCNIGKYLNGGICPHKEVKEVK